MKTNQENRQVSEKVTSMKTECDHLNDWSKKNSHVHKNLTQNGEPQRHSWRARRRRRGSYLTVDHLQTIDQLIEKCICNGFKDPFCIAYNEYEKVFDSIEHEAIFKVLRTTGINEAYITVLEDIYTGATTKVHMDN